MCDNIFVVVLVRLDSVRLAFHSNVPFTHQLSSCHGLVDNVVSLLRAVATAPLEHHHLQLVLVDGREIDGLNAVEAFGPLEEGRGCVGGLTRLLVHIAPVRPAAARKLPLLEHSVVVVQCLGLLRRLDYRV